jgi:ligand-binding sensor protein
LDDEELKAMAEEVSKLTDATRYCPLLLSIPKTEETRNTTEQHD